METRKHYSVGENTPTDTLTLQSWARQSYRHTNTTVMGRTLLHTHIPYSLEETHKLYSLVKDTPIETHKY